MQSAYALFKEAFMLGVDEAYKTLSSDLQYAEALEVISATEVQEEVIQDTFQRLVTDTMDKEQIIQNGMDVGYSYIMDAALLL